MTAVTLLSLLAVTGAVTLSAALRCHEDWQCGDGGVCDALLSCCSVRGCPRGCPAGQACVAIGYPRCGKLSKLADTCACPRKHGCVPLGQLVPELIFQQPPQQPKSQRSQAVSQQRPLPNAVSDGTSEVVSGRFFRVVTEVFPEELPHVLSGALPEALSETTVELLVERATHQDPPQSVSSPPPPEAPAAGTEQLRQEERSQPPPEDADEDDREWLDVFYDLQ